MIELIYNGLAQTIPPNGIAVFNVARVRSGVERWNDGSGQIRLPRNGRYLVTFSGNIAVPTGQTPAEISMAIAQDGEGINGTLMRVTPAGENAFFNISAQTYVSVEGCCETVTVKNTSTIPILLDNANFGVVRVAGGGF